MWRACWADRLIEPAQYHLIVPAVNADRLIEPAQYHLIEPGVNADRLTRGTVPFDRAEPVLARCVLSDC